MHWQSIYLIKKRKINKIIEMLHLDTFNIYNIQLYCILRTLHVCDIVYIVQYRYITLQAKTMAMAVKFGCVNGKRFIQHKCVQLSNSVYVFSFLMKYPFVIYTYFHCFKTLHALHSNVCLKTLHRRTQIDCFS